LSKEGREDFDLDLLLEHANCAAGRGQVDSPWPI
jgi:hypothetical protein